MMRLEISVLAARDLAEMHIYGLGRYGVTKADRYLEEIFERFEHVAQFPHAARERVATRPPVRLVRQKAHNILYSVEDETVTILRVFHHSADWIGLL